MRPSPHASRRLAAVLTVGVVAGIGVATAAVGTTTVRPRTAVAAVAIAPVGIAPVGIAPVGIAPVGIAPVATTPTTVARTVTINTTPVVARSAARVFDTGNAQLDALLPTLPAVLFEGHAHVHFGYNPIDCCHAGGYNPGPNDVWVSVRALSTNARLVYVTVHELGHSLHLHSSRGAALTAAVAGAPSVRPGSPWDVSEKVADCVAWALYPAQTAASGLTYWSCPAPWRAQVRAALA